MSRQPEPRVLAHVLARNDAAVLGPCLDSLARQDYGNLQVIVSDNASTDHSAAIAEAHPLHPEVQRNPSNLGYAEGHNRVIRRGGFDWFLALNADLVLAPDYVRRAVARGSESPQCGMVSGKLLRPGGPPQILDSTGVVLDRFRRNSERGGGERDRGQYATADEVFGAFGAAALLSRPLIADLSVDGELFDERFFAYREEVDLAWRAQSRGWRCFYAPLAVATHEHRYRRETRGQRPLFERRLQRRNRYLLLIKNESPLGLLRDLLPILSFEAAALLVALLREPGILPAYGEVLARLPALWQSRRQTRGRRTVPDSHLLRWFR